MYSLYRAIPKLKLFKIGLESNLEHIGKCQHLSTNNPRSVGQIKYLSTKIGGSGCNHHLIKWNQISLKRTNLITERCPGVCSTKPRLSWRQYGKNNSTESRVPQWRQVRQYSKNPCKVDSMAEPKPPGSVKAESCPAFRQDKARVKLKAEAAPAVATKMAASSEAPKQAAVQAQAATPMQAASSSQPSSASSQPPSAPSSKTEHDVDKRIAQCLQMKRAKHKGKGPAYGREVKKWIVKSKTVTKKLLKSSMSMSKKAVSSAKQQNEQLKKKKSDSLKKPAASATAKPKQEQKAKLDGKDAKSAEKKGAPCTKKEDKKEDPGAKKEEKKEEPCPKKEEKKEEPCPKKEEKKEEPCPKKEEKKEEPCPKKEEKKEEPCPKKEEKKEEPCPKKEEKKEEPCPKEDPCAKPKKEDPC